MSDDTNSSTLDPGTGYRLLEAGEIIQKGDEFLSHIGQWKRVASLGREWSPMAFRPYRRKIEVENLVEGHDETLIFDPDDADSVTSVAEYESRSTKPPLGLCPEYIWATSRATDILAAMTRYVAAGQKIPPAWFVELDNRLHEAKLVELTEDK